MADFHRVMSWPLETFTHAAIVAMGASEEIATETARHLVRSNLSGHDSHGVLRLPQYLAQMDAGLLDPCGGAKANRRHRRDRATRCRIWIRAILHRLRA